MHSGTMEHCEAHATQSAMGNINDIMLGEKSRIFVRTWLQTLTCLVSDPAITFVAMYGDALRYVLHFTLCDC